MTRREVALTGATFGDVLLVIAAIGLAAAMLYPGMRARAYERHLEAVVADVETVLEAVERVRADTGAWPERRPAEPVVRSESGALPREAAPTYRIEWRRLAIADVPEPLTDAEADVPEGLDDEDAPAPPEPSLHHLGLVSVHAADDGVLEALLGRWGMDRSFVHDTTWTLVLPRSPARVATTGTP